MNFCRKVKAVFLHADLFYSSQILKYNNETQYKTLSGAIFSLIIMGAIVTGFYSMIISTMERTSITSNLQVRKYENPEALKLKDADNKFMFAMAVTNIDASKIFNLTHGPQIFDLKMRKMEVRNKVITNVTQVPLQQCTRQHWKKHPSMLQRFDSLKGDQSLCPQLQSEIDLIGFRVSPFYKNVYIEIRPCFNSSLTGNRCAPQEVIDQTFTNYTNFYLRLLFTNPVINPNQPNYLSYYLEERNSLIFSKTSGVQMYVEFSDYEISTDVGILPYQEIQTDKGYIVQDRSIQYPYVVGSGQWVELFQVIFHKVTQQIGLYEISPQGFDGLIGALTALLFFVRSYTETALEISISNDLFYEVPGDQIQVKKEKFSFNFVVFITYYLYKLLKLCGKDQGFETSKKMEKYQEEIVKQLDIKVILQRIIKLQLCMSHLFDNEEIQGIKISEEVTYERARYLRALLHPNDQSQSSQNASGKKIEQEDKDKEKEIQKEKQKQKDKDYILQSQLSGIGILPMFPPIADTPVELSVDRQSEIQDSKRSSFLNNIKALRMNARTSDVKMKILLDIRKDMKLAMSTFFEQEQIPSAILIQRKIQRR